jgi:uncharacterized protein YciI
MSAPPEDLDMLFAWIGFLKPEAGPASQTLQVATTDFLAQPLIKIIYAGPLVESGGTRAGMMVIFEHDSREAAEEFVRASPYVAAALYERHGLYDFLNEVG